MELAQELGCWWARRLRLLWGRLLCLWQCLPQYYSFSMPVAAQATRARPGQMNLKGANTVTAIGRCISVLYDEGGPELVAYRGVVVP